MNRFRNRLLLAVAMMACGTLLAPSTQVSAAGKKKIVFVAGRKSHGYGSHEHYAGCKLIAKCLQSAMPELECVVTKDGFPEDLSVFDDCAAIVIFSDGGGGHPAMRYLKQVDALVDKGVGIACLHYAVEVPKGEPGEYLTKWIGGLLRAVLVGQPALGRAFSRRSRIIPFHAVSNHSRSTTNGTITCDSGPTWRASRRSCPRCPVPRR